MPITEIKSINAPGVSLFSKLTERQLLCCGKENNGVFIAESPKVIRIALKAGYRPISLLCEQRHIYGDAKDIVGHCKSIPIYTGERDLLSGITGYKLTRGVLCAMERKPQLRVNDICKTAKRIAVIYNVVDSTNVGAVFRSAAALGVDAVVLSANSCDPLNRRAVRVSMGSVFLVPWAWSESPFTELKELGFRTAALALTDNSVSLDNKELNSESKLAITVGTEGDGLPQSIITDADYVVKIPMHHKVDSLNVATAAAIAFWQLCK